MGSRVRISGLPFRRIIKLCVSDATDPFKGYSAIEVGIGVTRPKLDRLGQILNGGLVASLPN